MSTIQSVLDLARYDLNDVNKVRYDDTQMLKFINDGIALCYVIRPDLKFGSYSTAFTDLGTASTFPLPIEYRPALAAYVVAQVTSGDDEFVITQRADKAMIEYIKGIGL